MPSRSNTQTVASKSASAWCTTLTAIGSWKVRPIPTERVLAEQTVYCPKEPKHARSRRRLTQIQAMTRLLTLEAGEATSARRETALKMYQAVNPSWPESVHIRLRLTAIASNPWLVGRKTDKSGGAVIPKVAPRSSLRGLLNAQTGIIMEAMVTEQRSQYDHSMVVLRYIHKNARWWVKWWS